MDSIEEKKSPSIPIIDFLSWTSPFNVSPEDRLETARELVEACHTTGFVYITNHGISPELLAEAFAMSKKFFDLPTEIKMKAGNPQSFKGYSWPGLENNAAISDEGTTVPGTEKPVIDLTECYGMGSELNHSDPNVWLPSDVLPDFKSFNTKFYWECWRTAQLVLKAVAKGLGLPDEDFLLKFHTGHENELSVRHYPPISAGVVEKQEMRRMSSHTDFDSLTLLFQDDCGGFEVEKIGSPGVYLPVDPIEGALVMNIGDALQRWSNDYLISTKHRVHLPPLQDRYTGEGRMTRQRYSIPYFVLPKPDTTMSCLPGCSSKENPPKYEPTLFGDWYQQQAAAVFGGYGGD